ncbi:GntR family transcriptional regulator [Haloechinothrix salitolerans]
MTPARSGPQRSYVVEYLTTSLSERIADNEFEVGTWIRQEKVAKEYGVSRTPVSLALNKLEAMGVVERIANRGFRVRYPSLLDIIEVTEVRGVLEGHAAFRAATRITEPRMVDLRSAVDAFRQVVEMVRRGEDGAGALWQRANSGFHATIFDAAGNAQLEKSAEMLHHRLPRNITWLALRSDPRLLAQNADEHANIAEAIESRDGEKARELAVAHMDTARDLISAHFESRR